MQHKLRALEQELQEERAARESEVEQASLRTVAALSSAAEAQASAETAQPVRSFCPTIWSELRLASLICRRAAYAAQASTETTLGAARIQVAARGAGPWGAGVPGPEEKRAGHAIAMKATLLQTKRPHVVRDFLHRLGAVAADHVLVVRRHHHGGLRAGHCRASAPPRGQPPRHLL